MQFPEYRRVMRKLDACDPLHTFILAATPEYENIGDHAITLAEKAFLRERFPGYDVIEINHNLLVGYFDRISARLSSLGVTILVQGGGNIGSIHFFTGEYPLRLLLKHCPANRIIVFPQTYYCSNDEHGRKVLSESQLIYAFHERFTMFLRDGSFDKAKEYFPKNDIEAVPDMVFYLDDPCCAKSYDRDGLLVCFRSDAERLCSEAELKETLTKLRESGERLSSTSMLHTLPRIYSEARKRVVEAKLHEFMNAEVVLTDRLHAMILAVVTNTPCIALDNVTGKVGGVYRKWLKDLGFVCLVSSLDEIPAALAKLRERYGKDIKAGICEYDKSHFSSYWDLMQARIQP